MDNRWRVCFCVPSATLWKHTRTRPSAGCVIAESDQGINTVYTGGPLSLSAVDRKGVCDGARERPGKRRQTKTQETRQDETGAAERGHPSEGQSRRRSARLTCFRRIMTAAIRVGSASLSMEGWGTSRVAHPPTHSARRDTRLTTSNPRSRAKFLPRVLYKPA